jgi:hypothetical protein
MFRIKLLRTVSLMTLFFFIFFTFAADFSMARPQDEDSLAKARKLYQEGDYEGSIKLLSDFITKLKAMVEQKKNVAEAFYLLAKIYFEVGDDTRLEENLQKVFETYPAFKTEESNFAFKERVEKARNKFLAGKEMQAKDKEKELAQMEKEMTQKEKPRVIEQPTPKKAKKKFPVLLVVGVVLVVAVLVVLLAGKKKDKTPAPEVFDIRGDWTLWDTSAGDVLWAYFNFSGSLTGGTFVDHEGDTGTYTVSNRTVNFHYDLYNISFTGNFTDQNNMQGSYTSALGTRNWRAARGISGSMAPKTYSSSLKNLKTNK